MVKCSLAPFDGTIVFTKCWCQGDLINLIILQTENLEHGGVNWVLQGLTDSWCQSSDHCPCPVTLPPVPLAWCWCCQRQRRNWTGGPALSGRDGNREGLQAPGPDFSSVGLLPLFSCYSLLCSIMLVSKPLQHVSYFNSWKTPCRQCAQSRQYSSHNPPPPLQFCVSALVKLCLEDVWDDIREQASPKLQKPERLN